jgi:hypothetical protein
MRQSLHHSLVMNCDVLSLFQVQAEGSRRDQPSPGGKVVLRVVHHFPVSKVLSIAIIDHHHT